MEYSSITVEYSVYVTMVLIVRSFVAIHLCPYTHSEYTSDMGIEKRAAEPSMEESAVGLINVAPPLDPSPFSGVVAQCCFPSSLAFGCVHTLSSSDRFTYFLAYRFRFIHLFYCSLVKKC